MARFNPSELKRKLREAQRRAEQEMKREVDRVNRANNKAVDDYNRKAEVHNKKVIAGHNARLSQHNRRADSHNKKVVADLNRQLQSGTGSVRYTEPEQRLANECTMRSQRSIPESTTPS